MTSASTTPSSWRPPQIMKVGVIGCGAVGGYYGAQLLKDGHDVHFLLRADYEAVQRRGVILESSGERETLHPKAARTPTEIGPCDLVIVALKSTANAALGELAPPLLKRGAAVLTLQNGLGNEEALARFAPPEDVFGGLCFVCLNRTAPGVIRHIAFGQITLGAFREASHERAARLVEVFNHASVPCELTGNLDKARWEKLVWNIPFNGLGVAGAAGLEAMRGIDPVQRRQGCLSTSELLGHPEWFERVRELMGEVIGIARAFNHAISFDFAGELIDRTKRMGAYKPSTVLDFEKGHPIEIDSVFLEPLRRARLVHADSPLLGRLCEVLTALAKG